MTKRGDEVCALLQEIGLPAVRGEPVSADVIGLNAFFLSLVNAGAPLEDRVSFVEGNAEALAFPDHNFDAYTIAFGIRNTTHLDDALDEAYRVLRPGGRFLCLEFSRVAVPGLDRLYDLYSFSVLPRLGELVAGDGAAYRYLAESIRRFPSQRTFARLIGEAGFDQVKYRNLSGGIAAMHSGWKV